MTSRRHRSGIPSGHAPSGRARHVATALLLLLVLLVPACGGGDAGGSDDATPAAGDGSDAGGEDGEGDEGGEATEDGDDTASGFPVDGWRVADPADHDIDPEALEAARDFAFQDGMHTQGLVVVHRGEIVGEWYADGADEGSWAASWSMAKSFASAVVGLAIADGSIPSVDEPMTTWYPQWVGTPQEDMTLRHVLQMDSGLRWNEDYSLEDGPSDVIDMVATVADQLEYATTRPSEVPPGTRWQYSSGDSMLLSGVIEQSTGTSAAEYAREHLFEPIGMEQVEWWSDAEGHTLTYCCLDATSRDYARFGLLYLNGGRWAGEQVVPADWVEDSLTPTPNEDGYGFQWWLHTDEMDEVLPDDLFMAQGFDGQWIYVVPSLDLVVVRNSTYVRSDGPAVADPTLFEHYPPAGLVEGRGTRPPELPWSHGELLGPIVEAVPA